ncbi:MAG: GAF domain-containing protein [Actinomycetota bacterium]|nr:GAF domain-containing protein [Actinomycetota bacterium]
MDAAFGVAAVALVVALLPRPERAAVRRRGGADRDLSVARARLRLVSRWLTLAALVAAAAAPVLGIQAGASSGTARLVLLACTGLAAAFGVGIATMQRLEAQDRQQEAEEAAHEAREDFALALGGSLGPTADYLGRLTVAETEADQHALLGQLLQAALVAAVTVGPPDSRSSLYLIDPKGAALLRRAWAGRSGAPRPRFADDTPDGEFALDVVRRGEALLVADVGTHPQVNPTRVGAYDCLVAVTVRAGGHHHGLLTLDAPGAGALTSTELELVSVLANLVGAGLASARGVLLDSDEEA